MIFFFCFYFVPDTYDIYCIIFFPTGYGTHCPEGSMVRGNMCYALHTELLSFEDAEKKCTESRGHLVSFQTQDEYDIAKLVVG